MLSMCDVFSRSFTVKIVLAFTSPTTSHVKMEEEDES